MSSGVQSQIGAKWKEDFVTTINSGFGNAGTPRSMNRKGVREGRERGVQGIPQHYGVGRTGKPPAPVPVAMLRSYALTFETEQEKAGRQRKALVEEEQDLRRLIQRLGRRCDGLKKREENLDDEIDILVGDHGAEEPLVHDRCVTSAKNSIRKFGDDLESFDDNMVCERQGAEKFRPTYDGIFRTFEDDIHRMRGSVRFMTQKVDRYHGINTMFIKNGFVEGEEASLIEKDDSHELMALLMHLVLQARPKRSQGNPCHASQRNAVAFSELLIKNSLEFLAAQERLMADEALLETFQGSWSQDENHQAMLLEVESVYLLMNSTKLQDDLVEAAKQEEEKAGGELVTRLKQQSKMIYAMKGESSAMIRSLLYIKHQKLKSERKVTLQALVSKE